MKKEKLKKFLPVLLILAVACVVCVCVLLPSTDAPFAGSGNNPEDDKRELTKIASVTYNWVSPGYDDVILYQDGAKFGVLRNDGSVRIPAKYDRLETLNPKYLKFKKGNQVGIVSSDGKEIHKGEYNDIAYIGGEYFLLETATPCNAKDEKAVEGYGGAYYHFTYQLFSLTSKAIVEEVDLSFMTFTVMRLCRATENDIFIIDCIPYLKNNYYVYHMENQKWSSFDSPYSDEGYTLQDDVVYDSHGNVVLDAKTAGYDGIYSDYGFEDIFFAHKDSQCILIDKNGKEIFSAKRETYDATNSAEFQNGYIVIKNEGYYGVIDKEGNVVIPFRYDEIRYYYNDIFAVRMNKHWGFIDTKGETLLEPTVEATYGYGYDHFKIGNTDCLINPYTGEVYKYKQADALDKEKGIYEVESEEGTAISTPQQVLTEFIYSLISVSEDQKVYTAKKGNTYDIYIFS